MSNLRAVEKKWIENFRKSPLIDEATAGFNSGFAFQLFYGKSENSLCPSDFLFDFKGYYNNHSTLDILAVLEKCNEFLSFIGVKLNGDRLKEYVKNNPVEYKKFVDKCYYILKTLAHHGQTLVLSNPYKDTFREIDYLLRIECGEVQLKIFDEPLFLPDLYSRVMKKISL
jgi:ATP-dependent DNA helicase PIF1